VDLEPLVNKRASLRFMGAEASIALSHALFSSFDVDSGSRLLLKVLAARGELGSARTLLDSGCGTGVLGIAAAAAHPGLSVRAVDRDALALAFTGMNARVNGLEGRVTAEGGLLSEPRGLRFDRIVSNLPAKAGEDALRDFLVRAPSRLERGGMVAIVIVKTLADFARKEIERAGHELVHAEEGPGHDVYLFAPGSGSEPGPSDADDYDGLGPYGRGTCAFTLRGTGYSLRAVRGLPDFDSPGYGTELAARILEDQPRAEGSSAVVLNPGQGHVPLYLALALGYRDQILAGRDLLGLRASARALGEANAACSAFHIALPSGLGAETARVGATPPRLVVAFPEDAPGYPWCETAAETAVSLLAPGGRFIVCARSSLLADMGKRRPAGMRTVADKKEKGFRAIAYERA